jgi:two-component system NarL family response regulator
MADDPPPIDGPPSAVRVLVVDDHVALTMALSFVFAQQDDLEVVGSAATLAEARRLLAQGLRYDVALVDLQLGDGSGLDLIPELAAVNRGGGVIVLSGTINDRSRALAVAAGASGMLDKAAASPAVIADHIRAVCRGEPLIPPAEAVALLIRGKQFQREEHAARTALARLTPREREVLQAIADGLGDRAIADRFFLSVGTVRNHVAALLRKLEVDSRYQAVMVANQFGIVRLR